VSRYLEPGAAATRLSAFGVTYTPSTGQLDLASRHIDSLGPFVGAKYSYPQPLAFPRTVTLEGDTESQVPGAILDAVALLAYAESQDSMTPIASESVLDASVTYAVPKRDRTLRRAYTLVGPYLRTRGSLS
jgi:hypothetical protein